MNVPLLVKVPLFWKVMFPDPAMCDVTAPALIVRLKKLLALLPVIELGFPVNVNVDVPPSIVPPLLENEFVIEFSEVPNAFDPLPVTDKLWNVVVPATVYTPPPAFR